MFTILGLVFHAWTFRNVDIEFGSTFRGKFRNTEVNFTSDTHQSRVHLPPAPSPPPAGIECLQELVMHFIGATKLHAVGSVSYAKNVLQNGISISSLSLQTITIKIKIN